MCTKQTATYHSSFESELICLDTSIRMLAFLALVLWDEIMDMFCPFPAKPRATLCHPIDVVPTCEDYPLARCMCIVFEDNEVAIRMTIKQCSPHMQ